MRITLTWRELHKEEAHTKTFNLEKPIRIGRSPHNDIVLNDRGVSREHASIVFEADKTLLKDSSTNGTWMNTQAVRQCELKDGNSFQVMSFRFTILRIEVAVAPSKPAVESQSPNAIRPAMDLAEIIKQQPFIENLIDLMPDKKEG
ncbi:MAG: FHA domain-containing protein [Chitinophagales bacterium]